MALRNFTKLDDFITYVQGGFPAKDIPFKIMGAKKSGRPYQSASLFVESYNRVPCLDKLGTAKAQSYFGEIYNYGSRLDSSLTYSSIKPEEDGKIAILQGDLLVMPGSSLDLDYDYLMVLSHSCGTNYSRLVACPVFREDQLTTEVLQKLKNGKVPNPDQLIKNWMWNENINYLGLPEHPAENIKGGGRYLVCLSLPFNISTAVAKDIGPSYRLTYKSLAYLQMRLALQYFRDVQNSDDSRDM